MSELGPKPTLEIIPEVGVPPVRLTMSEQEVRSALGDPDPEYPGVWYYFENCFQINFEAGKVNFIELSWCDAQFDVQYRGVSVFHTPAEELVRIISGEEAAADIDAFEFTSHELDLGLWRPVVPSMYSPEDPDDEYRKGVYWQTIGIGDGHFLRDAGEGSRKAVD